MSEQAGLRAVIGIMSVEEVGMLLDVTTHTLAIWRTESKGPAYARLGRSIFYRRSDVEEWIANNVIRPGVEAA